MRRATSYRAALITMPFALASHPSIQLGLLQALGEREGFRVDSYHLNLHLAARLSLDIYDVLGNHRGPLTSEWLFAREAFGKTAATIQKFFSAYGEEIKILKGSNLPLNKLGKIHSRIIPQFLKECLTLTNWGKYDLIGFTSTFQQNVASLALAGRLKNKYPKVKIAFGGANLEGEMGVEYLRAFPFIDFVSTGEGDLLFPALLKRLSTSGTTEDIPGLAQRINGSVHATPSGPPLQDLDSLPTPNYQDYFERSKKLNLSLADLQTSLPLETARGCWWGEKHHCTFCGLNGMNMNFRSKSIERVLTETSELSKKHKLRTFSTTDNILNLTYLRELFKRTYEERLHYIFGWEIKANLTREQIRTMNLGGMKFLQPGIESLNTHVLQLMRKGCSMLQNLITLKWCRYYDIDVLWNLLYGFPGEKEEDYLQEMNVLRLVSHLQPPGTCSRIWLERFSPYFFDREKFPVTNIRPESSYAYVYPPNVSLEKIAYMFEYDMGETVPESIHDEKKAWVNRWIRKWNRHQPDTMTFHFDDGKLLIQDRRTLLRQHDNASKDYKFSGAKAWVYDLCSDTYRTVRQIQEDLEKTPVRTCSEQTIKTVLNSFCEQGLMISEDGKYFSLALPEPVAATWSFILPNRIADERKRLAKPIIS